MAMVLALAILVLWAVLTYELSDSARNALEIAQLSLAVLLLADYAYQAATAEIFAEFVLSFVTFAFLVGALSGVLVFFVPGWPALQFLCVTRLYTGFERLGVVDDSSLFLSAAKLAMIILTILVFATGFLLLWETQVYAVQQLTFLDGFYFAWVTLSTVGYGDITPMSVLSQVTVILLILVVFIVVPLQTGRVVALMRRRGRSSLSRGLGHAHPFAVVGRPSISTLATVLRETSPHTFLVVVFTAEPHDEMKKFLRIRAIKHRSAFLCGDVLSEGLLLTAQVPRARVLFVVDEAPHVTDSGAPVLAFDDIRIETKERIHEGATATGEYVTFTPPPCDISAALRVGALRASAPSSRILSVASTREGALHARLMGASNVLVVPELAAALLVKGILAPGSATLLVAALQSRISRIRHHSRKVQKRLRRRAKSFLRDKKHLELYDDAALVEKVVRERPRDASETRGLALLAASLDIDAFGDGLTSDFDTVTAGRSFEDVPFSEAAANLYITYEAFLVGFRNTSDAPGDFCVGPGSGRISFGAELVVVSAFNVPRVVEFVNVTEDNIAHAGLLFDETRGAAPPTEREPASEDDARSQQLRSREKLRLEGGKRFLATDFPLLTPLETPRSTYEASQPSTFSSESDEAEAGLYVILGIHPHIRTIVKALHRSHPTAVVLLLALTDIESLSYITRGFTLDVVTRMSEDVFRDYIGHERSPLLFIQGSPLSPTTLRRAGVALPFCAGILGISEQIHESATFTRGLGPLLLNAVGLALCDVDVGMYPPVFFIASPGIFRLMAGPFDVANRKKTAKSRSLSWELPYREYLSLPFSAGNVISEQFLMSLLPREAVAPLEANIIRDLIAHEKRGRLLTVRVSAEMDQSQFSEIFFHALMGGIVPNKRPLLILGLRGSSAATDMLLGLNRREFADASWDALDDLDPLLCVMRVSRGRKVFVCPGPDFHISEGDLLIALETTCPVVTPDFINGISLSTP
eukprot:gnl/Chilomastix_cuspidata/4344.p1 GENE.gnl/Chilomastix_cuspidata/4344~~gnl/Chilomastix_cuspidata/4344.p1  ORF type:complete len:984 (-),score=518.82 gnl/Chilomastix_cuspidata/4344:1416-4367(-)